MNSKHCLIILFLACVLAAQPATAQENHQTRYRSGDRPATQTLFSANVRHGGFISPIYGMTSINGSVVMLRGTRGAWIINLSPRHALHLGLAGYSTRQDADAVSWPHEDINRPGIRTEYGGFEVEYVNRSYRMVHMGTQMLVGSGSVRYEERNIDLDKTRDNYFVVQPGVNLFLNVTNWFRISGGLYYRHVSNARLEGTGDADLSGLAGILGFRFGRF